MKNSMNNSQKQLIQTILGVVMAMVLVLVIGFSIGGGQIVYEDKIVYQEKEQPMLLVDFVSWAESSDDSSNRIFNYWMYNFGKVEARGVIITCEIYDGEDNVLKSEDFNAGNFASTSSSYEESIMKYSGMYSESKTGVCFVKSANGDYLDLMDILED